MTDIIVYALKSLAQNASYSGQNFSIVWDGQMWLFSIGDHTFMTPEITTESLLSANTFILSSIRRKENW